MSTKKYRAEYGGGLGLQGLSELQRARSLYLSGPSAQQWSCLARGPGTSPTLNRRSGPATVMTDAEQAQEFRPI